MGTFASIAHANRDSAALSRFLVALALALVGISVVLVVFVGALFNHRYGAPMLGFFVMAVAPYIVFRRETADAAIRATIWSAAAVVAVVFVASAITYGVFTSHNYMQEPTEEAAEIVRAEWDKHFTCGPAYILGDRPSAHGIAIAGDRRGAGVPLEDIRVASWLRPRTARPRRRDRRVSQGHPHRRGASRPPRHHHRR